MSTVSKRVGIAHLKLYFPSYFTKIFPLFVNGQRKSTETMHIWTLFCKYLLQSVFLFFLFLVSDNPLRQCRKGSTEAGNMWLRVIPIVRNKCRGKLGRHWYWPFPVIFTTHFWYKYWIFNLRQCTLLGWFWFSFLCESLIQGGKLGRHSVIFSI